MLYYYSPSVFQILSIQKKKGEREIQFREEKKGKNYDELENENFRLSNSSTRIIYFNYILNSRMQRDRSFAIK